MAIVESTFAERLRAIARISETEITNYEISGDLRIKEQPYFRNCMILNCVFSQFCQVCELFKALDTIQREIRRDDQALVRNGEEETIRKAFCNFRALIYHTGADIITRIYAVEARTFAYIPLNFEIEDGKPAPNTNGLRGHELDRAFKVLCEDLEHRDCSHPNSRTLQFFIRIIDYGVFLSHRDPKHMDLIQQKISNAAFQLFQKPYLNNEETEFLKLIFGNRYFTGSMYSPETFINFLESMIKEKTNISEDSFVKVRSCKEIMNVFTKTTHFFVSHQLPMRSFTDYRSFYMRKDLLDEVFSDLPALNRDPEIRPILKALFTFNTGYQWLSIFKEFSIIVSMPLFESGFLEKDEKYAISKEWLGVMNTFECTEDYFLNNICKFLKPYKSTLN